MASGDFDGRGVWTFEQDGAFVDITYDWRLSAEKPLLRNLSFLLKPLFEANHRWAMAQGEESLKLELARRRATSRRGARAAFRRRRAPSPTRASRSSAARPLSAPGSRISSSAHDAATESSDTNTRTFRAVVPSWLDYFSSSDFNDASARSHPCATTS